VREKKGKSAAPTSHPGAGGKKKKRSKGEEKSERLFPAFSSPGGKLRKKGG